jgi:hypothetical protein
VLIERVFLSRLGGVPRHDAPADPPRPLTAQGYTVTRGANGEITLARPSAPFDWRIVPAALACATIVLPTALALLGSASGAISLGFPLVLATTMAFAFITASYALAPPLLLVSARIVFGQRSPEGQPLLRVDARTWPAGEGVDLLLTNRMVMPKNGSSYWVYGVLVLLPDAFVELHLGRDEEAARQLQASLCEALQQQPIEIQYSPEDSDADIVPIFVGMASTCLALVPFVLPTFVGHARIATLAGGAWAAAAGWAGALAVRAILRKAGPHMLHEAWKFARERRKLA